MHAEYCILGVHILATFPGWGLHPIVESREAEEHPYLGPCVVVKKCNLGPPRVRLGK